MKALVSMSFFAPFLNNFILAEVSALLVFLELMGSVCYEWALPKVYFVSFMTDKLSYFLSVLTIWMLLLMSMIETRKSMIFSMISLTLCLLGIFSVTSVIYFFVLFESSLIPTLILILGGGYQPERLEASYYLFFYTVVFSIPLVIVLIWMTKKSETKYFYFEEELFATNDLVGYVLLILFMIKLPIFMLHFWLPKAHVEAPVVGSMILAGVLLKTGGYGIFRFFGFVKCDSIYMVFASLAAVGMVMVCSICLYCPDLKQLIAYSSVSHMNFLLTGVMINSISSFTGGLIMMISHGLCSSLLFFLADLVYKHSGSRSMIFNKGVLMILPILSLMWALAIAFNMSFPSTPGSLSEFMILASVIYNEGSFLVLTLFILYLFFSAFYSVHMYTSIFHGIGSQMSSSPIKAKSYLIICSHLLPLILLTILNKMMTLY